MSENIHISIRYVIVEWPPLQPSYLVLSQVLGHSVGCDFSPDGRILASGSSDGSLVCYDFHLAKSITSLAQPGSVCLDVAWHPVLFSTVASTSTDGTISIWQ